MRRHAPSLRELAWLVCRDVNRTFGGGHAAIELLRRTLTRRGWLDASGHALLIAVSRLTPGTNLLAYCVALGWRTHAAAGSLLALLAGSVPAALFVFALSATLVQVDRYRSVQALLAVAMVVAVALVFSSAWHLLRPFLSRQRRMMTAAVVVVSAALIAIDMTPVRVLLAAAAVGAAWPPGRSDAAAA